MMKHGEFGKCTVSLFAAVALLGATVPIMQTKADTTTPVTFQAENAELNHYARYSSNVGGATYDFSTLQTIAEIQSQGIDKARMPYVQYTVDAAATGDYALTDAVSFTGTHPNPTYNTTIEVDGKVYLVPLNGTISNQTSTITVHLQQGRNVITCSYLPKESANNSNAYLDQDYIQIVGNVSDPSLYSPAENVKTSVTQQAEGLTYFNQYKPTDFSVYPVSNKGVDIYQGKSALSLCTDNTSTTNHGTSPSANLGISTANFSTENMDRVPYSAITVNATTAGYYTVAAVVRLNNGGGSTLAHGCVLVNGKKQIVPFYCYASYMTQDDTNYPKNQRVINTVVHLQPGNNELVFSGILADTFTGATNTANEWIDFDAFLLSGGLKMATAQADPHDATITSKLTDNALDVTINNPNPSCQYQVWCYSKIGSDVFGSDSSDQYSWVLWKTFASNQFTVPVINPTTDPDGNYRVMVLTLDGQGNVVGQSCNNVLVLTGQQINAAKIQNVFFDGKAVSDAASVNCGDGTIPVQVPVKVVANNADFCIVSYYDGTQEQTSQVNFSNNVAETTVDFMNFQPGTYKFTVKVQNGGTTDSKDFYVRVYSYDSNKVQSVTYPEINTLSGHFTNNSIDVTLAAADGKPALDNRFNYFFSLAEPGRSSADSTFCSSPEATLTSKGYGMYAVYGSAGHSRSGYDDAVLQCINNQRPSEQGTLSVSSLDVTSGGGAANESNAALNTTYKIKANVAATGAMVDQLANVKYSFWRNDANGWVLIKEWCAKDADHPDADTLNWTPASIGKYDIQVRVQGPGAGSYEALKGITFVVKDSGKTAADGTVSVQVPTGCTARTPVQLSASVTGSSSSNLLYRFDISDANLGSRILQAYSPDSTCVFIPRKSTTYTVTVKVISQDSFGMYDIESDPANIVVN